MSYSELTFVFIFMPITIIPFLLIFKTNNKVIKNIWLLIISFGFYFLSGRKTLFIFCVLILITYLLGNLVYSKKKSKEQQKGWIILSVSILVGILCIYKFYQPIISLFKDDSVSQTFNLITPVGISFVIFESVSYVVDIYRGEATPGSFIDTAIFLSFFPKLISGPIVQWKDFQKQTYLLEAPGKIEDISEGVRRIIIGYAKKVIIADSFGSMIYAINNSIASVGIDAQTMWLKYAFYFFQIYFDFAGYSDIAIGLSKIFGISIKENFNYPYLSRSITEFWRRWHISLGSWFREYVYIPMGGNRKGNVYIHLFVVFFLTGLWHGTGLPFILWGILNGLLVLFERAIRNKKWYQKTPQIIKWAMTSIAVYFLWIVFSSSNLEEMIQTFRCMFSVSSAQEYNYTWEYFLSRKAIILLAVAFLMSVYGEIKDNIILTRIRENNIIRVVEKMLLIMLFAMAIVFMVNKSYSPFMYFMF